MVRLLSQCAPVALASAGDLHRRPSFSYLRESEPRRDPRSKPQRSYPVLPSYPNAQITRPDLCPALLGFPESLGCAAHTHAPHNPPSNSSRRDNPYLRPCPAPANPPPSP